MNRKELARFLARSAQVSDATAQDRVDEVVYRILKRLRSGKPVDLPGVGKLKAKSRGGK